MHNNTPNRKKSIKMITPNIEFKSVLQPIKDIKARNQAFRELTDEGKRLEIAWEALQLVLSDKIHPAVGCYWSNNLWEIEAPTAHGFQQKLINKLPKCEVCQRGLIMLSTIRIGNSVSSDDWGRDEGHRHNISGFDMEDMKDMEKEYEHGYFEHPYETHTKEKLANICCNILVNGNFNTDDKTDYLSHE